MADTVIVGTGIIGLSTAFYLSKNQPGSSIHLIDSSPELFASASGFAGGFLARDWFQSELSSLGELSFEAHEKLAEEHNGRQKWGYTKTTSVSYQPGRGVIGNRGGKDWLQEGRSRAEVVEDWEEGKDDGEAPPWIKRRRGDSLSVIDADGNTAIVDPLRLCQFLLKECKEAGITVHHPATPLSATTDLRGDLSCVRIGYTDSSTETELPATKILISAGAWTPKVFETLFPHASLKIPVGSFAGNSLAVKTPGSASDVHYSVYCTIGNYSAELYSRTNGIIYIAGVNSPGMPLPHLATGAKAVEGSLDELERIASLLIKSDGDLEIVRSGLCFRPVTKNGMPFIGRIPDDKLGGVSTRSGGDGGVFVAAGHGPWGISLSLGTGKVVSELMLGKEPSADIDALHI